MPGSDPVYQPKHAKPERAQQIADAIGDLLAERVPYPQRLIDALEVAQAIAVEDERVSAQTHTLVLHAYGHARRESESATAAYRRR